MISLKEKIKIFWKPFILIFLISFLIVNWVDVSWLFNYKVVSGITSEIVSASPEYPGKEDSLEIPKIDISVPLVFVEDSNEKDLYQALDKGVVYFPDSVLPGQIGQTIILGHSAPPNWPKIKYDWVFSRLNELITQDKVFIYFNNQKYSYLVVRKIFLDRGEEIPERDLTNNRNVLVLISCWPPGKDYKRIAVEAISQ